MSDNLQLKGFEQLFKLNTSPEQDARADNGYFVIATERLKPGKYQPRQDFSEAGLQELADSIKKNGIIQPIITRKIDEISFEIVAGERRWRAAKKAGLLEVPIIVRDIPDDTVLVFALIENIQREDLNPIDRIMALARLQDEFGMTHEQIANAVGMSRSSITNLMRLLTLPEEIKAYLQQGEIQTGHAKALLGLETEQQLELAREIISKKYTVRVAEQLALQLKLAAEGAIKPNELFLKRKALIGNDMLSKRLSSPVQIDIDSTGQGRVVIAFDSQDKLDWLIACLNAHEPK